MAIEACKKARTFKIVDAEFEVECGREDGDHDQHLAPFTTENGDTVHFIWHEE